jgi:hypothetical protein
LSVSGKADDLITIDSGFIDSNNISL